MIRLMGGEVKPIKQGMIKQILIGEVHLFAMLIEEKLWMLNITLPISS